MKTFSVGLVWKSLKDSVKAFGSDKIPKLSASLAYYTGFSLAPLLVLLIAIGGLVLGQEAVEGTVNDQIGGIVGSEAAKQIQEMIRNASLTGESTFATVVSGAVLLISATTIFGEIQDSINSIWGLKPKPSAGIMSLLMTRLISFGMIASLGFILLVSLIATTVLEGVGSRLQNYFPEVSLVLFYILNLVFTLCIITLLFAVIFKVLPDVKIKWRAVLPGAIVTAILFMIGKFGISLYISKSDLGSSYGAASSLAIIFVWIYYSAIILYFGAEFTKAYALNKGEKIIPDKYVEWNEQPTVPGAEPKTPPASSSPSEKESRPVQRQPSPQIALASRERMEYLDRRQEGDQQKKPGMGTVLLGLVLYFATRGKDRKEAPQ